MVCLMQARQIEDVEAQLHILLGSHYTSRLRPEDSGQASLKTQQELPSTVPQSQASVVGQEPLPKAQGISVEDGIAARKTDGEKGQSHDSARGDDRTLKQSQKAEKSDPQRRRISRPSSAKTKKVSSSPGVALYGDAMERMHHTAER